MQANAYDHLTQEIRDTETGRNKAQCPSKSQRQAQQDKPAPGFPGSPAVKRTNCRKYIKFSHPTAGHVSMDGND